MVGLIQDGKGSHILEHTPGDMCKKSLNIFDTVKYQSLERKGPENQLY